MFVRLAIAQSRQSLQEITLQAGQLLSRDSIVQHYIRDRFDEHAALLAQLIEHQNAQPGTEVPNDHESSSHDEASSPALPSTFHPPPGATFAALRRQLQDGSECNHWCSCICHQVQYMQTPQRLAPVTASFRADFAGISIRIGSCSLKNCRQRSRLRLRVTLGFSRWILGRIISLSIHLSKSDAIHFDLRAVRVRHENDWVLHYARIGDVSEIRRLFSIGQASVDDVDSSFHQSLLRASIATSFPIT